MGGGEGCGLKLWRCLGACRGGPHVSESILTVFMFSSCDFLLSDLLSFLACENYIPLFLRGFRRASERGSSFAPGLISRSLHGGF